MDISTEETNPMAQISSNSNESFWDIIETMTGFVVPAYIRNVLQFHGFDNPMTVAMLEENDIQAIEKFASSGQMSRTLNSSALVKDFYGPFAESPSDFQILRGYRKVLVSISTFIRENGPQAICDKAKLKLKTFDTIDQFGANNGVKPFGLLTPTSENYDLNSTTESTALLNAMSPGVKPKCTSSPKLRARRNCIVLSGRRQTFRKVQTKRSISALSRNARKSQDQPQR